MQQHYILNIDPQADCEWERCIIRNPLTGEHPDFKKAIAKTLPNRSGSYLVKVSIDVEILETADASSKKQSSVTNNSLSIAQKNGLPTISPLPFVSS